MDIREKHVRSFAAMDFSPWDCWDFIGLPPAAVEHGDMACTLVWLLNGWQNMGFPLRDLVKIDRKRLTR